MEPNKPVDKAPNDEPGIVNGVPTDPGGDEPTEPVDGEPGGDADNQPDNDAPEPGDGEPAEPEEPDYVKDLREQVAELKEKLESRAGDKDEPAPAAPQPLTAEQRAEFEKNFGFSRAKDDDGNETLAIDPQKLIQSVGELVSTALQRANAYADKLVHGNVSDIRFDTVLSGMEKDHPGIRQLAPAIKEYLKARYEPKDHSNPKFIQDGFYWARGKDMKKTLQKFQNNRDVRKTIVRPANPTAGARPRSSGRLTVESMTEEQRQIARATFRDLPEQQAYREYARMF